MNKNDHPINVLAVVAHWGGDLKTLSIRFSTVLSNILNSVVFFPSGPTGPSTIIIFTRTTAAMTPRIAAKPIKNALFFMFA